MEPANDPVSTVNIVGIFSPGVQQSNKHQLIGQSVTTPDSVGEKSINIQSNSRYLFFLLFALWTI